jgi:protein-S-isoprenylcysteine O-methyltransferase Ste14
VNVRALVGSGDRIGAVVLPVAVLGIGLNLLEPGWFSVGGPPTWLTCLSVGVLFVGIAAWAWSVGLILAMVPRHRLITGGPFRITRHPLYTSVALLVLPWLGFICNTWVGVVIGLALYVASRMYAPAEEVSLAKEFGPAWDRYRTHVLLPWL